MPVPDFSPGEILTAAVMDSVGLWRVTNCTVTSVGGTSATASNGVITVGAGNTSVTVNAAFSSSWENYKIVYSGGAGSTDITLSLKLGGSTTGYYSIVNYATYAAATTGLSAGDNNAGQWTYMGYAGTNYSQLCVDLIGPNLAKWTTYANASWAGTTIAGDSNGVHQVATAYTSFILGVNTGSLTGGTIRVYGYNK